MNCSSFGSLTSILHNSPAELTFTSDRAFSQSARSIQTRFDPRAAVVGEYGDKLINSLPVHKGNTRRHNFLSDVRRSEIYPIPGLQNGHIGQRESLYQCFHSNSSFEGPLSPNPKNENLEDMLKNLIPSETTISTPNSYPSQLREPSFDLLPKKSLLKIPNQSSTGSRKSLSVRISDEIEVIEVENWKIFNTDMAQSNLNQQVRASSVCLIF